MVHLCPRISNDFDIFGEELIAVLVMSAEGAIEVAAKLLDLRGRRELGTAMWCQCLWPVTVRSSSRLTVFFFARSPDAPRTTITVLSLSSMVLERARLVSKIDQLTVPDERADECLTTQESSQRVSHAYQTYPAFSSTSGWMTVSAISVLVIVDTEGMGE